MRPVGLESLPLGYTRLEFLECTGTQAVNNFIHLPDNPGAVVGVMSFLGGNRHILSCPNQLFIVPRRTQDNKFWGEFEGTRIENFILPKPNYNKKIDISLNWLQSGYCTLDEQVRAIGTSELVAKANAMLHLFAYNSANVYFFLGRCYYARVSGGKKIVFDAIPTLDSTGKPCMFDLVTRKPFYNSGSGQFIAGFTMAQALNLAYLPATGGSLTVSLPLEAAFDEAVQNALNTASSKGWTINVQYRESELTAKNIDADFLESTGTQYIDTGCAFDNNTGIACTFIYTNSRYNMNVIAGREDGIDNRLYSPYFGAEGSWTIGYEQYIVTGILNPDPFRTICSTSTNFKNDKKLLVQDTELRSLDANANFSCPYTLVIFGARVSRIVSNHLIGRVFEAQISQGSEIVRSFIPALSPAGTPCLHDTISDQNVYNVGTGAFIVGFDTTEKAAISISKLPVTTAGELTISLPAAAQDTASLVPEAINIATKRGWTIITQYRED